MDSSFIDFHTHHSDENYFLIKNYIVGKESLPEQHSFSAGIHPWYIDEKNWAHHFSKLENDALHRQCMMIGECGLDKLVKTDFKLQTEIFTQQILLAEKLQKPVIVHCVKAFLELVALKKKLRPTVPLIVHGYNNNPNIAKTLIESGFYLSFGTALLNEKSNARQVLTIVPPTHFFLETDDKKEDISKIYDIATVVLNMDLVVLKERIRMNFQQIL